MACWRKTDLVLRLSQLQAHQFDVFGPHQPNISLSLSHEIHKNIITYNLNHHFPRIFTAFSHVSDLDVLQFSGFVAGFRMWSPTPLPSRPVPCWCRYFRNAAPKRYRKVGKPGNSWKYVEIMGVRPCWTTEKGHFSEVPMEDKLPCFIGKSSNQKGHGSWWNDEWPLWDEDFLGSRKGERERVSAAY